MSECNSVNVSQIWIFNSLCGSFNREDGIIQMEQLRPTESTYCTQQGTQRAPTVSLGASRDSMVNNIMEPS